MPSRLSNHSKGYHMAKSESISYVTPLGRARYPKLDKQDVYEGKEVGYKLGIIFDDADFKRVENAINEAIAKLAPEGKLRKGKATPIKEDKEGNQYVEFKTYQKVPLFGAKGSVRLPEGTIVGGGSLVRAKVTFRCDQKTNGHLVGYLNSVQVAELVKGGGAGFDDVEGFDTPDHEGFEDTDTDALDI